MTIGDLFVNLVVGNDGEFKSEVAKTSGEAGATGAKSFGDRFGKGMKVVATAAGAAIGALFATAAKNAIALNTATAKWRAETGATAREAVAAQQTINGLFRQNLQGYDEIGATLAALQTDLGLTQDQAAKAAQSFLDFANATGISSTDAVKGLDDVTAAYNLKADASQGIMDLLVASHQRYGGSVAENTAALIKMAPALQAMNLGVEDGNAILNLFADSGVKASAAQAALNGAITKLPKGTSLNEFLVRLQNTHSDAKRAELAVSVFGTRAGPALANALGKSKTALKDHHIKIKDVKDVAHHAAGAITDSFGAQAQQMLKDFGGALADVGTQFGPLLPAFAMLGQTLTPVLTVAGGVAGFAFGHAFLIASLGVVGLLAAGLALAFVSIQDGSAKAAADDLGKVLGDTIFGAMMGSRWKDLPTQTKTDILDKIEADWYAAMGRIIDSVIGQDTGLVPKVVNGFVELNRGAIDALFGQDTGIFPKLVNTITGIPDRLKDVGGRIIDPIVTSIRDGINSIIDFWNSLDFKIDEFHIDFPGITIPNPTYGVIPGDLLPGWLRDKASIDILGPSRFNIFGGTDDLIPDIPRLGSGGGPRHGPRRGARGETSLATGMESVPYDGFLARLHRREMVVPAAEADALRDGAMLGHDVVEHRHTISLEGARNLREAGYDEGAVARMLRSSAGALLGGLSRTMQVSR